ncbi:hypothetical protein B0H19DRAFT_1082452 [Mycena capillaripes]|nr:hypothetical protein B0H19DRAFT_1082452 [Mycena capillaripes]
MVGGDATVEAFKREGGDGGRAPVIRRVELALRVCLPARTLLGCYRMGRRAISVSEAPQYKDVYQFHASVREKSTHLNVLGDGAYSQLPRRPWARRVGMSTAKAMSNGGQGEGSVTAPDMESVAIWYAFKRAPNGEQSGLRNADEEGGHADVHDGGDAALNSERQRCDEKRR